MTLEQLSHINSSLKSICLQIIKEKIKFLKTRRVLEETRIPQELLKAVNTKCSLETPQSLTCS